MYFKLIQLFTVLLFCSLFLSTLSASRYELEKECFDLVKKTTTVQQYLPSLDIYRERERVPTEMLNQRETADVCIQCTNPEAVVECVKHIEIRHIKPYHVSHICHGATDSSVHECWRDSVTHSTNPDALRMSSINESVEKCSGISEVVFLRHLAKDKSFTYVHPLNLSSRKYPVPKKQRDEL